MANFDHEEYPRSPEGHRAFSSNAVLGYDAIFHTIGTALNMELKKKEYITEQRS